MPARGNEKPHTENRVYDLQRRLGHARAEGQEPGRTERLPAALLDRLTHRFHIFEMKGESYRFRESMKSKKGSAKNKNGAKAK